jgi:hypothetical protein
MSAFVSREPMSDLVPSYNDASAPFDTGGEWAAYQSALLTCRTVAPTASAKYPKYSLQVKPSSSLTFRTDPTTRSAGASSARRMASATLSTKTVFGGTSRHSTSTRAPSSRCSIGRTTIVGPNGP